MIEKNPETVKVLLTSEINPRTFDTVIKAFNILSREAELKIKIPVELANLQDYKMRDEEHSGKYISIEQIFCHPYIRSQSNKVDLDKIPGILNELLVQFFGDSHYKNNYLIITQKFDLKSEGTDYVIGGAWEGFGAIISLLRTTRNYLPKASLCENMSFSDFEKEMLITQILHEFGHVYGCAKEGRKFTVNNIGSHDDPMFVENCMMLQGLNVPDDWIRMTKKRLSSMNPYCNLCRHELKKHFSTLRVT